MTKAFWILSLVAVAIHCEARRAFAQSELSVGYQFIRLSTADGSVNLPQGFAVDYTHTVADGWKVLAVLGWARHDTNGSVDAFAVDSRLTQLTVGGGLRRDIKTQTKAIPYVQAAIGVADSSFRATSNGLVATDETSSDLFVEPGAGVAYNAGAALGVFGQLDYRRVWPDQASEVFFHETVDGFRVFVGVRITMR
jgi:hypothetical protein